MKNWEISLRTTPRGKIYTGVKNNSLHDPMEMLLGNTKKYMQQYKDSSYFTGYSLIDRGSDNWKGPIDRRSFRPRVW